MLPLHTAVRFAPVFLFLAVCVGAYGQDAPTPGENGASSLSQPEEPPAKEPPLFSGPQVSESFPSADVFIVKPDQPQSELLDLGELAKSAPLVVAFMHDKSRPAFQMTRLLAEFAKRRADSKLRVIVVVLTDDRSSSEQWLKQIHRYFEPPTSLAVAAGGIEGPGTLGLNRLVDMTILVAEDGKVTANFALTQVSAAADGPAVLKAINEVSGGGEVPDIQELLPQPKAAQMRPR